MIKEKFLNHWKQAKICHPFFFFFWHLFGKTVPVRLQISTRTWREHSRAWRELICLMFSVLLNFNTLKLSPFSLTKELIFKLIKINKTKWNSL